MNANPLKQQFLHASSFDDVEAKLRICDEFNHVCRKVGWKRWYYVQPATDVRPSEIRTVDGVEADEVFTVMSGRKIDYYKWPQHRLDKVERHARWLIKQGTLPQQSAA